MKRLNIVITLLLLLCSSAVWSSDNSKAIELWGKGNAHYSNSEYSEAIALYDKVVELGAEGIQLYYNLGNAHFKNGNIGKSIVWYRRALRLAPHDADILYNLEIAKGQTKNRIEPLPEFILTTWVKDVRSSLSSNNWAVASIVLFALLLGMVVLILLANSSAKRKLYSSATILCIAGFIITTWFASTLKREMLYSNKAIVISSAEEVKSSPSTKGNSMFIINEGAEVEIVDVVGDWSQIVIASGNKGWIESDAIEKI